MITQTAVRGPTGARRADARAVLILLALVGAPNVSAQEQTSVPPLPTPSYAVPPAAATQRALSDNPSVDRSLFPGLYGQVGVSVAHHSNVQRSSVAGENDRSDTALLLTPRVGWRTNIGRHAAELRWTSYVAVYDELENEDFSDYTVDGRVNLDIARNTSADLFAGFTKAHEDRGASGTRLDQGLDRDKVEIVNYGGIVNLGSFSTRTHFAVGADRSQWRYKNNNQEVRDRDYNNVYGRVYYNFSPKTSPFVELRYTDIDYLQPVRNLDSTETSYLVGVSWRATAITHGELSVGQLKKDFDDPTIADPTETIYAARVTWRPRRRTGFNFYASRRTEETTDIDADFFVSQLIGARVDQAIADHWRASAYANYTEDDFTSGRADEITDWGMGLDYAFRRWLTLGVAYSRIDRDSNVPEAVYKDEIWLFNVVLTGAKTFGFGDYR